MGSQQQQGISDGMKGPYGQHKMAPISNPTTQSASVLTAAMGPREMIEGGLLCVSARAYSPLTLHKARAFSDKLLELLKYTADGPFGSHKVLEGRDVLLVHVSAALKITIQTRGDP